MMKSASWLGFSSLIVFSLAAAPQAHAFGKKRSDDPNYHSKIRFADDVPDAQVAQLQKDLILLESLQLKDVDPEMLRIMHLKEASGSELQAWLEQHVQSVVSETMDLEHAAYVASPSYSYENAWIFPQREEGGKVPEKGDKVLTVMANIGSAVYQAGKQNEILLGLNVPGLGKIELTSPRVGVIQIGEGLFLPMKKTMTDTTTVGSSLERLGVFFHEARHSDGNGLSLGFNHAVCPEGSDYANYYACDRNLNGPYTMGAQVTAAFAKNCATCTAEEAEVLKLRALDSFSRVIRVTDDVPSTEWDDRPEGRL